MGKGVGGAIGVAVLLMIAGLLMVGAEINSLITNIGYVMVIVGLVGAVAAIAGMVS